MKCKQCGNEFHARRSTAKHCSAKCKQASYRNKPDAPVTLTPDNVVTVTARRQRCTDPETLAIWELHKAQRRPTVYPAGCLYV